MTSVPSTPGRLVELREDECWDFLRHHQVGRMAWVDEGRPRIVPLNFVAHEDAVWVRTTAYSQLAQQATGSSVAFEVDDVDPFTQSGTSVVVRGTAVQAGPREHWQGPETWVEGTRALVLRIDSSEVTGRRVLPS